MRRSFHYLLQNVNATVIILLVTGILVLVNYISSRHYHRFDTTKNKHFTLSDKTKKILDKLDKDVKIMYFSNEFDENIELLISQFSYVSKKIQFEFIDPDKNPVKTKSYDVTEYGTLVIAVNEINKKIRKINEEEITNTILKLTKEGKKRIFFTQGHGEGDLADTDREGLSSFKKYAEDENYSVDEIMPVREKEISDDCAAIVISSPDKPFLENEVNIVLTYLKNGGNLLLLIDPGKEPPLEKIFDYIGIYPDKNMVADLSGIGSIFGADAFMPICSNYGDHPITKNFNVMTLFPEASSFHPTAESAGNESSRSSTELVRTFEQSFSVSQEELLAIQDKNEEYKFDPSNHTKGPFALAYAVSMTRQTKTSEEKPDSTEGTSEEVGSPEADNERTEKQDETRIVVFGDSDFARNSYIGFQGNKDLLINALNWLAEEEDLISIRPNKPEDSRIVLNSDQTYTLFIFSLILLPGVGIVLGILSWLKRR